MKDIFLKIKEKIRDFYKKSDKNILFGLILLVFLAGIVRSYNFSEWLLFRADQVRDVEVAKEVLDEGIGHLRLMGPKIEKVFIEGDSGEGDTFNMGPYYYYVQYFSMKITGSSDPFVAALPDLIFSLLSIPLFYLLLRQFFSKKVSFLTTTIFSFSFLVVQYSRFAWNPNQLFFWEVLLLYAMLQAVKNNLYSARWALVSVFSLLIISQLHFLAFMGFSLFFIIFYLLKKPQNLRLKHFIVVILIFLIFYSPVIASEIKNNADNSKRFFVALTQRTSEESFGENLIENINKHSRFYLYFPASVHDDEIEGIEKVGTIFIIASLLLIVLVYKNKINLFDRSSGKNKFLLLTLVYFFTFFVVFISVADRLEKPRYWIPVTPLPFIFLAMWFEFLNNKIKKGLVENFILFLMVGGLLFSNLYGVYWWYASLKEGVKLELPYKDPILRPHRDLITLGELKRATIHMGEVSQENNKPVCFFATEYQIINSFKYLGSYMFPGIDYNRFKPGKKEQIDCNFFVISKIKEDKEDVEKEFSENFKADTMYRDGAIVVWDLKPKNSVTKISKEDEDEKLLSDSKVYQWKGLFN